MASFADLREALSTVDALELRRVATAWGVRPYFYSRGKQRFLHRETLVSRLLESASTDALASELVTLVRGGAWRSWTGNPLHAFGRGGVLLPSGKQSEAYPHVDGDTEATEATEHAEQEATASASEHVPHASTTGDGFGLLTALERYVAEAVRNVRQDILDPEQIRAIVAEAIRNLPPRVVEIRTADVPPIRIENPHVQFPKLVRYVVALVAAGKHANLYLAGPAGSGKSTAAEQLAAVLSEIWQEDVVFRFNGAIDSEYKLSGFVNAMGQIVSAPFREAYPVPSVYLFDELDRSLPSATLAFNGAMANGHCDFPGLAEPVQRHPHNVALAACNTWGHGADAQYVGAMKQDGSFLDRFLKLPWNYDEALERAIAGNGAWVDRIQGLRAKARERGLRVIISPRASIMGAALISQGIPESEALALTVTDGIPSQADREALGLERLP